VTTTSEVQARNRAGVARQARWLTLDEWVDKTAEGTEDPYRYLDRDIEEREAIDDLLGRRE
jgi:hypothetical protein